MTEMLNPNAQSAAKSLAASGLSELSLAAEHGHSDTGMVQQQDFVAPPATRTQKIVMTIAVVGPFLGVVAAAILLWQYGWMGWPYLAMVIGGWVLTSLGITIGFHRLLSHKSFDTYRGVRAFWMVMGALSVEGAPLIWCAVHRRHHGHSDQDGDPHSPHLCGTGFWAMCKGLWHSQVGWLFTGYWSKPEMERYIPDLIKDKWLTMIDRYYYVFVIASLLIPTMLGVVVEWAWGDGSRSLWFGALLGFIWGGLVRIFWTHHMTWSINSICHVFGKREYHSDDYSTNNPLFAVLSMGEGWHNNHHAFPSSARHGLKWYQFDLSWIIIRTMKMLGLAWNIKLPSERALAARRIKPNA